MNEGDYPALWQFLGAYLHQDWRNDYSDTSEALSEFLAGESGLAPTLPSEIDGLLASTRTSDDLEAALVELGSFYVPSAWGQDPRVWLCMIRAEATRARQTG